ncbi:MAG: outer membrane protein assembly factor BamC [Rubrivivax sp.]|nr:outer membrane protein assembly factor BamC [Rubrivivax sp.]
MDSGPRGLVDYRAAATPNKPLEVPPDLSQLARETRYQPQGGVVSAAAAANVPTGAVTAAAPGVVPTQRGDIRVERQGNQRWLVVGRSPDQLWPQVRAFWEGAGFTLAVENREAGVMETNWNENRAKLPSDVVRNTIGGLLNRLYDTGERDQYRTRIERSAAGTEIHIGHRGIEEVYADERNQSTTWRARPSDPSLEAEMLARLMVALGGVAEEPARAAVAAAPEVPAKARAVGGSGVAALEVDDPFDRAWRRVSLALDRGGFTVEDRDRAAGLFYVRYVDPRFAGREGPGFFSRLFSNAPDPSVPVRYRIAVKGGTDKSTVSVLTASGESDVGENGQRIVALLVNELK